MHLTRFFHRGIVLLALLALAMPLTALADGGKRGNDGRVLYATNTAGKLLRFNSDDPRRCARRRSPASRWGSRSRGSTSDPLRATCTRSAVTGSSTGSTRTRRSPCPRGRASTRAPDPLRHRQRVRLQSDSRQDPRHERRRRQPPAESRRRHPADGRHEAGRRRAYSGRIGVHELVLHRLATRPTVTELYAYDIGASPDKLWIQRPANAGTLIMPLTTGLSRRQRRLRHCRRGQCRVARGHLHGPQRLPPLPARREHGPDEVAWTDRRRLPHDHRSRSSPDQ